jgi:SAM-dependent methyltransferase
MVITTEILKSAGRVAFGLDPARYDRARPDYPAWVFECLSSRCDVGTSTAAFEIGAGTGKATRQLLALGANPVVAIEPDPRLAAFLSEGGRTVPALRIVNSVFEDADLAPSSFDLGICATAFHWLDESSALQRIADALRPGGWWAPFWNIYGDPQKRDTFHEATLDLLASGPPNLSNRGHPHLEFGADVDARVSALRAAGAFDSIEVHRSAWSVTLDGSQVMDLYASYSNVSLRSDREAVLAELGRIAREDFGNRVTRNITTVLYLARRMPSD